MKTSIGKEIAERKKQERKKAKEVILALKDKTIADLQPHEVKQLLTALALLAGISDKHGIIKTE